MKISKGVIAGILIAIAGSALADRNDQPRQGRDSVYARAGAAVAAPSAMTQRERANGRDSVYAMGKRVTTNMHSAESSLLKRLGRS